MRKFATILAALMLCGSVMGAGFGGVDESISVGSSIGSIKTFAIWANLATTTEPIADLNGTASVEAASGSITATGWTTPTIYVDGVASATIAADGWHHIAVVSDTAVAASAVTLAQDGASYGDMSLQHFRSGTVAWTAREVANDYSTRSLLYGHANTNAGFRAQGDVAQMLRDDTSIVPDESGNGNDGTPVNDPLWVSVFDGREGVYYFDGVDQYITSPDNSSLSFGNGSSDSPFSVSMRVNMTDATRFRAISKYTDDDPAGFAEWSVTTDAADKLRFTLFDNSISVSEGKVSTSALTADEGVWVHYVATYDGRGGTSAGDGVVLYRNGVVLPSSITSEGSYTAMHDLGIDLDIGIAAKDTAATPTYANGYMDIISIYPAALTATQVSNDYFNGTSPTNAAVLDMSFDWFYKTNVTAFADSLTMYGYRTGEEIVEVQDSSPSQNNGTLEPSPTTGPTWSGAVGDTNGVTRYGVYDFDGVNDRITITDGFTNTMKSDNTNTVSFWIKANDLSNSPIAITHSTSAQYFIELKSDGDIDWYSTGARNYPVGLTEGEWYHIVAVKNGTGNNGILYLNGEEQTSYSGTLGSISATAGHLYLGEYTASNLNLNGSIDNVQIFDRALSASEIQNLYNGTAPTNTPVLDMRFDRESYKKTSLYGNKTMTYNGGVTNE